MKRTSLVILFSFLVSISVFAQLKVGDDAPQFSATSDSNKPWNSGDIIGNKILVVYFYPAAMTGGCTKQACAFRDDKTKLDGLDVVVVGISGDEVKNLAYFKKAYDLNFPLLSDQDGSIARKFGVPVKEGGSIVRNIDGNDLTLERGVTSSRWTFIIDKAGKVVYINTNVNAEEDSQQTIHVIEKL